MARIHKVREPDDGWLVDEAGNILCHSFCFRDEQGNDVSILGKRVKADDPDFEAFVSGSGRLYLIRKPLLRFLKETRIPYNRTPGRVVNVWQGPPKKANEVSQ